MTPSPNATMTVLVYSDDSEVRDQVRLGLGRRPAAELPPIEIVEIATEPAVIRRGPRRARDDQVDPSEVQRGARTVTVLASLAR